MFELIGQMLSYPFLVRALIVGVLVSLCAALLGVTLVLKRYSMIGDGLSHVGFGALAVAAALGAAPLAVCIPVVSAAAVLLLRLSESTRIKGDAATALISSASLAIGVLTVSLSGGMNTDVNNYMFGSILSLSREDTVLSVALAVIVLLLYLLFFNRLFAVTFDETFARATGTKAGMYNLLVALLTAVTVVLGMRMMGALLISSLIIFPALSVMRVCRTFRRTAVAAALLSVGCFLVGTVASFAWELPTGATVVAANILAFILCAAWGMIKRIGK
ncbi:MAG: metal ABC transporter permease [Ruminococcaceae bacterium]|nr:metal ABC transporter permease [Oscillospiraceae bacterium]